MKNNFNCCYEIFFCGFGKVFYLDNREWCWEIIGGENCLWLVS